MKLVFLGPPGAGKGTQASIMAEQFDLQHASTGDIFREAVAEGSELGQTVNSYLDEGKLVPDELTARVVREMVLQREDEYILDGFPRTVPQAELLDGILRERKEKLDGVLYFELDSESAVERLTGRVVCSKCGKNYHKKFMPPQKDMICDECGGELTVRSDSTEDVVRKRLEEYEHKTRPLVPYYKEKGLLYRVDASPSPEEVSEQTQEILTALE
ncbi:MAG: adenylate kinase [Candidatus Brocadiia bacterium]